MSLALLSTWTQSTLIIWKDGDGCVKLVTTWILWFTHLWHMAQSTGSAPFYSPAGGPQCWSALWNRIETGKFVILIIRQWLSKTRGDELRWSTGKGIYFRFLGRSWNLCFSKTDLHGRRVHLGSPCWFVPGWYTPFRRACAPHPASYLEPVLK